MPSAIRSTSAPAATSIGMPAEAARIATCDVGPPSAVQMPASRDLSIASSCDGSRSGAIRIVSGGSSGGAAQAVADERGDHPPLEIHEVRGALDQQRIAGGADCLPRRLACGSPGKAGASPLVDFAPLRRASRSGSPSSSRCAAASSAAARSVSISDPGDRVERLASRLRSSATPSPSRGTGRFGEPELDDLADRQARRERQSDRRRRGLGATAEARCASPRPPAIRATTASTAAAPSGPRPMMRKLVTVANAEAEHVRPCCAHWRRDPRRRSG